MNSANVFLSYRREDSIGHTGRLHDRLSDHWGKGRIFSDMDNITAGNDFEEEIQNTLTTCSVLLLVIGPTWLEATNETGRRRLEDPSDLHRREVELAIAHELHLVPILVGGARMPASSDLPASLHPLARRQAFEIRDVSFRSDSKSLTEAIDKILSRNLPAPAKVSPPSLLPAPPASYVAPPPAPSANRIKRFRVQLAEMTGTFVAQTKSGDYITSDQILGKLDSEIVRSRYEGVVLEIRGGAVSPGKVLCKTTLTPEFAHAETTGAHSNEEVVHSLMEGTFHRAPAPTDRPYVEVGTSIEAGEVVGFIEAQKTFFPIQAPCSGVVIRILREDGAFVARGESLLLLRRRYEDSKDDPKSSPSYSWIRG